LTDSPQQSTIQTQKDNIYEENVMKITTRTEQVITVRDWDTLVETTYGRPYSFQQQDGCKQRQRVKIAIPDDAEDYANHEVPEEVNHEEMGVSFKAWLQRDPKQLLNSPDEWDRKNGLSMWWERNFYPAVEMIANDLHAKGLIEAGTYTIDIDW
jgi:hypothetical protein